MKISANQLEKYITRCEDLNKSLCNQEGGQENGLKLREDYKIGHAYFMKIVDFCVPQKVQKDSGDDVSEMIITPFALERLWDYHIEPLLEEYLGSQYYDGEKINIIRKKLRPNFCQEIKIE
jgi:hypothetical protein